MKLVDVIKIIESINEEQIIFQENMEDFNSDIILSTGDEGDGGIKVVDTKKYYYLIEIFLAKEFIEDWVETLTYAPDHNEIAKRLYNYAINDA
ncbi:hypothetical protein [Mucilaginibacter lappiensis]|uniref:hypothetical protein n=1 Tax=Mucilaginibacter lappiensis TaxID=354630 RepID=UPI003D203F41